MSSQEIYPWFKTVWSSIGIEQKDKFHHGIILSGVPGIGRQHFAEQLIESLLCIDNRGNGKACLQCRACELYAADANADYKTILLEEGKTQISVDQIRNSISWVNTSHQFNAKKVLFIPQANLMTVQASNSLLKTLEEPPADCVIILLVEHAESLLPTIRSRCRIVSLPVPERQQAKNWLVEQNIANELSLDLELLLDICNHAPLKVRDMLAGEEYQQRQKILKEILAVGMEADDPILVAKNLDKLDLQTVLFWFYALVMDLIRLKSRLRDDFITNKDYLQQLYQLNDSLNLILLYQLYGELNLYFRQKNRQLNQQLLLESLLIRWRNCVIVL